MQADQIKSGYWILLFIILTIDCSDLPVVTDQENYQTYVVYCVLSPDYTEHSAYIGRLIPFHDPIDYDEAQVTISDGERHWTLESQGSGYYNISSTFFQPIPLHDYTLKVVTKDNIRISAQTVVPDTFSIIFPTNQDSITANLNRHEVKSSLSIQCSASQGAHLYKGWVESRLLQGPHIKSFCSTSTDLSVTMRFWIVSMVLAILGVAIRLLG